MTYQIINEINYAPNLPAVVYPATKELSISQLSEPLTVADLVEHIPGLGMPT